MKKAVILTICALIVYSSFAQKTITGKIVDTEGNAIGGVRIEVQGTNNITLSDINGNYQLDNIPDDGIVIFSCEGMNSLSYKAEEISSVLTVTLNYIHRDPGKPETPCRYADIHSKYCYDSKLYESSNTINILTALKAKVPGAEITTASGKPAATTIINLRGNNFLTDEQPLILLDGIPLTNYISAGYSLNGSYDFGNTISDINPFDIESVEIIPGVSGSAIYGSRAADGIISIKTKSGNTGPNIIYNSLYTYETPSRLPQFQNVFGQGIFGNWWQIENTSWGPKFDGIERQWGYVLDEVYFTKPYSAQEDNMASFFETGHTFNNSISFSGSNERASFYLSYSNVKRDGIFPVSKDYYKRNTVLINTSYKILDNLNTSASFYFINKTGHDVLTGQGNRVMNLIQQQPRDIPITDLRLYDDYEFFSIDYYYSKYTTNPYYILNEFDNFNKNNNILGNFLLTYSIADYLSANFRLNGNFLNEKQHSHEPIAIPEGPNEGYIISEGEVVESQNSFSEYNSDVFLDFDKTFGMINIRVFGGYNVNSSNYVSFYQSVQDLDIEGFYDISNSGNTPDINDYESLVRYIAAYGKLGISLKQILFADFIYRKEWHSTLPEDNNSDVFPALNAAFVLSELIGADNILNYGRIRFGWGKTGHQINPYLLSNQFSQAFYTDGIGYLSMPLTNGITSVDAYTVGNYTGSSTLDLPSKKEIELGIDFIGFNNIIEFSVSYYKNNNDLVLFSSVPSSTGYSGSFINGGNIQNKGFEILFGINPAKTNDLSWNITAYYSRNRGMLTELPEEMDQIDIIALIGGTQIYLRLKPDEPIALFEGTQPLIYTDANGDHIVVDANGLPLRDTELDILGNSERNFTAGLINTISLYGFELSFTFDWRKGGLMHSRTAAIMYYVGNCPQTLYNDRQPFIIPNSVMQIGTNQNGDPIYAENTRPVLADALGGAANTYWDLGGTLMGKHALIDKSYFKLRELVLKYSINSKYLAKLKISKFEVFLFGNNLIIWTPDENNFIDPEVFSLGIGMVSEFGEFSEPPQTKTVGFGFRIGF